MRSFLSACVAAALVAVACGGRSELGEPAPSSTGPGDSAPPPHSGVVLNTCSPTDGQAVAFIAADGATCASSGTNTDGRVAVFFYTALPVGPGTYLIGNNAPGAPSGATSCNAQNACHDAIKGTFILTKYDPEGTTAGGTYDLQFSDATSITGSFTLTICGNPINCG